MKQALDQVKKGIRHPSAKVKPSNIITPNAFEAAEIHRYTQDIKAIEVKYREFKAREEAEEQKIKDDGDEKSARQQPQQNKDFLLMDQSNIDYETMKNKYPLRDNVRDELSSSPDPNKGRISANDISAGFIEDSVMERPSQLETPINPNLLAGGGGPFNEEEFDQDNQKTRFKDEDKDDILKDMRFI